MCLCIQLQPNSTYTRTLTQTPTEPSCSLQSISSILRVNFSFSLSLSLNVYLYYTHVRIHKRLQQFKIYGITESRPPYWISVWFFFFFLFMHVTSYKMEMIEMFNLNSMDYSTNKMRYVHVSCHIIWQRKIKSIDGSLAL